MEILLNAVTEDVNLNCYSMLILYVAFLQYFPDSGNKQSDLGRLVFFFWHLRLNGELWYKNV